LTNSCVSDDSIADAIETATKEVAIMESQMELNKERKELVDKLRQALPAVMAAKDAVGDVVYSDGALSTKVKRLIALGIALRGCVTNCVLAQTEGALKAGASRDEILETLSVTVAISGTSGIAESVRVVKILDELGKL
jgi:AhpD family alkylhydroperoxidase